LAAVRLPRAGLETEGTIGAGSGSGGVGGASASTGISVTAGESSSPAFLRVARGFFAAATSLGALAMNEMDGVLIRSSMLSAFRRADGGLPSGEIHRRGG